jgi:hypothetical protein
MYKNHYTDYEVYRYTDNNKIIHTDYIKKVENYNLEDEIKDYIRMNEEDYNLSILANINKKADFKEWYDDKNATVFIIII